MIISSVFLIPNMGAAPQPSKTGILAIASVVEGCRPLVLMVDMQLKNNGASLTNAAEKAITYFSRDPKFQELVSDVGEVDWVEVDSMGCFDFMLPSWDGNECVWVDFMACTYKDDARNCNSFVGKYGEVAGVMLSHPMMDGVFLR